MRGQRLAFATTIALSMDSESLGRPASSQSRTFTGSPRMAFREKLAVYAIYSWLHRVMKSAVTRCLQVHNTHSEMCIQHGSS